MHPTGFEARRRTYARNVKWHAHENIPEMNKYGREKRRQTNNQHTKTHNHTHSRNVFDGAAKHFAAYSRRNAVNL